MPTREASADVLVVGGGVGGTAAGVAAARLGRRVLVTEETAWIGGQVTAQGVPPDEHPWIEQTGCTRSYRAFRDAVRAFYRANYPLRPRAKAASHLNPGNGWVGNLCHEPRVGAIVLEEMLKPLGARGRLQVERGYRPVEVDSQADRITGVLLKDVNTGECLHATAPFVLDATELGDLLELAGVELVTGAEGRNETDELHAPDQSDPWDQQAFTWCFALEHLRDEDHTIEKPHDYEFWRSYRPPSWPGPLLSWTALDPETMAPHERPLLSASPATQPHKDLWGFRRILHRELFLPGSFRSDITLVNWPQIDYRLKPLMGVSEDSRLQALGEARGLGLALLHWMQTEAPRPDGACGYPGLRLRGDVLGTADGFAKSPYVREARRIKARFTVTEQHVGVEARPGLMGAALFPDSVGVGAYRIDLHPSTSGRGYVDLDSWPFQIPLGALIPVRVDNLLPAAKNIGTTHITNGCFRLHPIEWNIGEAVGALAAYCVAQRVPPRAVLENERRLKDFQHLLTDNLGVQLAWPESIRRTSVASAPAGTRPRTGGRSI
jgi:hypothetical protein